MNENEALEYIQTIQTRLGSDYSLKEVTELSKRFGRPDRKTPVIHIAGTNGKGSVGNYISNILACAGYTVGRYVSPTLFDYRERIQRVSFKNGKSDITWIAADELANVLTRMQKICNDMISNGFLQPTAFEIETVMAYEMFARWKVDVAVVETGLGGRVDATNIVEQPVMCVFTSISRDHMQILGDTIPAIAAEKYGIIQKGTTVVSKYQKECYPLLQKICKEKHAALVTVDAQDIVSGKQQIMQTDFSYKGKAYCLSQGGEYQLENAAIAIEAVQQLVQMKRFHVLEEQIQKALYVSRWKGRFDVVAKQPFVIADGAHNEDAAKRLKKSLEQYFPEEKFLFVVGAFRDKEYEKVLQIMLPLAEMVETVTAPGSRGEDAEVLAKTVVSIQEEYGQKQGLKRASVHCAQTVSNAIRHCIACGREEKIVVFGSLSILAEAYDYFQCTEDRQEKVSLDTE